MFKFGKIFLVAVFLFLFFPLAGRTQANPVDLYFFEGQGCPHCAKMKSFLEGLKADYPNLKVYDFEVYFNKENQALFSKMAEVYKSDANGVPAIFIGDEAIQGEAYEKVKNAVEKCSGQVCASPISKIGQSTNNNDTNTLNGPKSNLTQNEIVGWGIISMVVLAGLFSIIFYFKKKK